ncbi:unnamed protein product, partial [Didymodactylos carnosus]
SSFAPFREKQLAHWFINGKSYMESIAKAILCAKEEIFITDWWLSPELMLIRPTDDETFRLDNLLGKKADEGVRVYVLIFKEFSYTMGLNSLHTKRALISKNKKNIKVIRHPNHYPAGGVFLWSHHEKMVIIDQKIAFIGGIDLCFGRWDDEFMRLVDLGPDNETELKMPDQLEAEKQASGKETVEASRMITTKMAEKAGEKQETGTDEMRSDTAKNINEPIAHGVAISGGGVKMTAKKWIESKLSDHSKVHPNSSFNDSFNDGILGHDSEDNFIKRTTVQARSKGNF